MSSCACCCVHVPFSVVHSVMAALMAEATHQCTPPASPPPQPLVLSHLLRKPHLTEMFKAIGKWSGEERPPSPRHPGPRQQWTPNRWEGEVDAACCGVPCTVCDTRTYVHTGYSPLKWWSKLCVKPRRICQ